MKRFRCCLGLALLVGACGPSATRPPSETAAGPSAPIVTPEELTAAPGHLVLAGIRILHNGSPALVLHPDGTLDMPGDGRIAGRLERDGRFLDPRGKLLATFTPDGEVVVGEDDFLPVTIDENGVINLLKEGRTIRLLGNGLLEGANPDGPTITIEGANEQTRRTAMFLLVLASYPTRQSAR